MGEILLKIADAAERLNVGKDWIYRRIASGEIPVVELGDTRKNQRIRESDLDAYIADRTFGGSVKREQRVHVISRGEPSDAAWLHSGDVAARILEGLAERDLLAAQEEDPVQSAESPQKPHDSTRQDSTQLR